ncbi:MAG: NUDIX hydrolase [Candidatus Sericytochromatia bacterium]|nr:NUDIX hydrolase [Candidatus Sericytochromatia bacterium]
MFAEFKPVFETEYFNLEAAPEEPCRGNGPYYRMTGPDSVICCVLDQDDRFVMVRQYRPNLETVTLEIPAGGIERGESPLVAARREILEETGLRCPLLPLGKSFSLMMNRTSIMDHLFFGMFPERTPHFVPEPGTEIVLVPRCDLLQFALRGEFLQIAGLGLLQLAGGILQLDLWRSSLREVGERFCRAPEVNWASSE